MSDKNAMLFIVYGLIYCSGFMFLLTEFAGISIAELSKPPPWQFYDILPGALSITYGVLSLFEEDDDDDFD